MFPTEEEKARETPAERRRRRSAAGTDRRALNQVAKAVLLLFCGLALLVAADVAGVEKRRTTATVVGFSDRFSAKRVRGCTTELLTGYGVATIFTNKACRDAPWHLGDTAEVEARQLRFTKTVVVSTHGTIFRTAQGGLPEW